MRLLTLDEAATELGVPVASLRRAAERHGFLVRVGRALRIDPNTLPELIERCREQPSPPVSTNAQMADSISVTADDSCQRALETAERLKKLSRATSLEETDRQQGPTLLMR